MNKKSFQFRLVLSYVFIVLASFVFIAYYLDKSLEENALLEIKSSLMKEASLVEYFLPSDFIRRQDKASLESRLKLPAQKIQSRITIVSPPGEVLFDSEKTPQEVARMENHADRPEIKTAFQGRTGESIRYSATLKIDMLYLALPLKDKGEIIGAIRLSLPLENVKKILLAIRKTVFLSLFFALGLAFFLGSLIARGIIKPIHKIIRSAGKFARGDFSRKILIDTEDEIGELADALNIMAQQIEEKVRKIEAQNQELLAILSSMVEGVIVVDKENRILSVNPTVERIFGISQDQVQGKFFLEGIPNNTLSDVIVEVLKKGEAASEELTLSWPVQKIFQVNATPVFERQAVCGCLLVIHDITEMRKLETVRKDFVANVSHELKTPLTSIKGFVETLLAGALEDKEHGHSFLEIIKDHADRLENLINDLLALAHLESKEIALKKEPLEIKDIADTILKGFKTQIHKRSLAIQNDLPGTLSVTADRDKLEQVLTNLIDNAVKFNKDKGSVRLYGETAQGEVKIVVEDAGIGIPAKDIPRIFERFYRVDKARSRQLGGTGLGLSIVKHCVELHGGKVGVESTEGLGSKFWFTLPS
ncbi:MAG: ATP-binding protein [Candidatus Omnitrophica bacterium]|nr:ATP-binding protein [Candidatus Omnitrophota bacterium]